MSTDPAVPTSVPTPPTGDDDPATDPPANPPAPPEDPATGDLGDAGKQAIERMKAERNAAKRDLKNLQTQLAQLQQAQMSESEKALSAAKAEGRKEAVDELGEELVRTRFDALAGRRNADFNTAEALEYVDLKKFLGDDGRPDAHALQAAVNRLVPEPKATTPSYDGGSRTPAAKRDMNAIIRQQAGVGRTAQ